MINNPTGDCISNSRLADGAEDDGYELIRHVHVSQYHNCLHLGVGSSEHGLSKPRLLDGKLHVLHHHVVAVILHVIQEPQHHQLRAHGARNVCKRCSKQRVSSFVLDVALDISAVPAAYEAALRRSLRQSRVFTHNTRRANDAAQAHSAANTNSTSKRRGRSTIATIQLDSSIIEGCMLILV